MDQLGIAVCENYDYVLEKVAERCGCELNYNTEVIEVKPFKLPGSTHVNFALKRQLG